ncbi:Vitamin B12 transporter BtuB [Sinobacterium norvegicum]|uniref:Vitamin B12 transporter BtuB n=1 Tax=Sinobacterium norvegicum TaxID=1641715 RepID=A0ABM9AFU3_9GAMM|nr:TonB-dependent receptor [Sinobacterium norvegicum]CAH0991620.1 Vitamin B12 transporter BtuB [Sinobacterium norvegicum]
MDKKRFNKKPLSAAIMSVAILGFGNTQAVAQDASLQLEEVIVTAQKRVENLQDVPVSVTAVSGDTLYDAGIQRMEGLQSYVPNLTMTETGIGTNIYIRGIGSGINQGFEQSVGMYVDGIYHGRAQLSRAPFLDLERVEVLRGPQMILFGKNSIAGAIDLHTAKPSDEFEAEITGNYEPEYNTTEVTGMVSGPITDSVGGRLAVRKMDTDGYTENLTRGEDGPTRDETSIRGVIDVAFTDSLEASLKVQHDSFDNTGRNIEIINAPDNAAGSNYGEALVRLGADDSVLNQKADYKRSADNKEFSNNDVTSVALNVDYSFDNDSQLTFITGYLAYDYDELCDCDFTGANIFNLQSQEDYSQLSQEIRFTSPGGEMFDYIVGAYAQTSELTFEDNLKIDQNSLLARVVNPNLADISAPRELNQDSDEWSVFGQVTWNISDRFRAIVGGRYSEEKKSADKSLAFKTIDGSDIDPSIKPSVDATLNGLFKVYEFEIEDERSKSNFAPMATVQFDLTDNMMTYATVSSGFKSGGFDARSNNTPYPTDGSDPGAFEFDDEEALNFEVGMKSRLLDGRATLNAAVYRTEYDDLQVSVFDGTLGFNVGNAAGAVSQGFEVDGRFRATEHLTFSTSIAYLDFEFEDYENGTCRYEQIAAGASVCDQSGETNQFVSPWTVNLMTEYVRPIGGSGVEVLANLDLLYKDSYYTAGSLEEDTKQQGYTTVNARIGLGGEDGSWDVSLVGKNLSDETVVSYSADTPLASTLGYKSQYGIVEAPRTIALQGGYRF